MCRQNNALAVRRSSRLKCFVGFIATIAVSQSDFVMRGAANVAARINARRDSDQRRRFDIASCALSVQNLKSRTVFDRGRITTAIASRYWRRCAHMAALVAGLIIASAKSSASIFWNTSALSQFRTAAAKCVGRKSARNSGDYPLIIATKQKESAGCSAITAIPGWAISAMTLAC